MLTAAQRTMRHRRRPDSGDYATYKRAEDSLPAMKQFGFGMCESAR